MQLNTLKRRATTGRSRVYRFAKRLVSALRQVPIPAGIQNEADFERRVLIPLATREADGGKGLSVYCHPWNNTRRCTPDCAAAAKGDGHVQIGCPACWHNTKEWSSVEAFGTHNNFDLVARDSGGHTLALETKFVVVRGGRMPNGELQRFIGQCALAATRHDVVIGLFGYRGALNPRWERDTKQVTAWCRRSGIHLVFREAL